MIEDGLTLVFFSLLDADPEVLDDFLIRSRAIEEGTRDRLTDDITASPAEERDEGLVAVNDRPVRERCVSDDEAFACESEGDPCFTRMPILVTTIHHVCVFNQRKSPVTSCTRT